MSFTCMLLGGLDVSSTVCPKHELSIPKGPLGFQSSVASSKKGPSGPKAKSH